MSDPIVDEVRRIREEHAAWFNYDLDAICADIKRLEKETGSPRVTFGPRRLDRPAPSSQPPTVEIKPNT
jgi:hypothetical protein